MKSLLALSAMLFALCVSVEAQQPGKVPRIGFLSGSGDPANPSIFEPSFRQALRDLGYVEGKTSFLRFAMLGGSGITFQI
jgi:hypothetical protein